ncbi:MAG: hypothetical protein AB1630_13185 [bacterium]
MPYISTDYISLVGDKLGEAPLKIEKDIGEDEAREQGQYYKNVILEYFPEH